MIREAKVGGLQIERLRKFLGMTQDEFGAVLYTSARQVRRWERSSANGYVAAAINLVLHVLPFMEARVTTLVQEHRDTERTFTTQNAFGVGVEE